MWTFQLISDVDQLNADARADIPLPVVQDARWEHSLEQLTTALHLSPKLSGAKSDRIEGECCIHQGCVNVVLDDGSKESAIAVTIAKLYGRFRRRPVLVTSDSDWARTWREIASDTSQLNAIMFWGIAKQFSMSVLDDLEEQILESHAPAIGYMVAEDPPQLIWLAFKSAVFQIVRPTFPDALYFHKISPAKNRWPEPNPLVLTGTTETVPLYGDPDGICQQYDGLGMAVHGRAYDSVLTANQELNVTLCSLPASKTRLGDVPATARFPLCYSGCECFRDENNRDVHGQIRHVKLQAHQLRSRSLFTTSCSAFRLGDADFATGSSLALRIEDSWCTNFLASRYESEGRTEDCYLWLAAWQAGLPVGTIQRLLSPGRLQRFSLLGDVEASRLARCNVGYDQAYLEADSIVIRSIRQNLIALPYDLPNVRYWDVLVDRRSEIPRTYLGPESACGVVMARLERCGKHLVLLGIDDTAIIPAKHVVLRPAS